jgi:hypothetical protein
MIRAVHEGAVMKARLELPFDESNPAHRRAADFSLRPAMESGIAELAGVPEVVIDVPEPISFESDLPIIGTGTSFSTWATVFRPDVVASFTRSLRVLRVFSMAGADSGGADRVAEAAVEVLAAR